MKKLITILAAVWIVKYSVIINRNVVPCVGQPVTQISTNTYQSPACVKTDLRPVEEKLNGWSGKDVRDYAERIKLWGAANVRVIKK